ncbi:hypothetical protein Tco_1470370 [Tanacetum coccineum]
MQLSTMLLRKSMDRENKEEFIKATAMSRKRCRDDQDPSLSPSKYSDQNKKKKHDYDASALKQPPVQKSSAWKTSSIDDVPTPDDVHFSDSEDTGAVQLPNIKTRPDWLKPVPEEAPETPEPDWVVPLNDLPETENNWANAIAKMYKDLEENKLLQKTGDM